MEYRGDIKIMMDNTQKQRYEAFWARDYFERAVLHIEVRSSSSYMDAPDDVTERWENIDYRIASFRQYMQNTRYFAEGIPNFWPNLGPGVLAAMMGSDYVYAPDTVWFGNTPMLQEWRDMDSIRLQTDNHMSRLSSAEEAEELVRKAKEYAK